jgi:hypothetical protein
MHEKGGEQEQLECRHLLHNYYVRNPDAMETHLPPWPMFLFNTKYLLVGTLMDKMCEPCDSHSHTYYTCPKQIKHQPSPPPKSVSPTINTDEKQPTEIQDNKQEDDNASTYLSPAWLASDEVSCTESQDLAGVAISFYIQASKIIEPLFRHHEHFNQYEYQVRQPYQAIIDTEPGDFHQTLKEIQNILFHIPGHIDWEKLNYPSNIAEAQMCMPPGSPINYLAELDKLIPFIIDDIYFRDVILKCYIHDETWVNENPTSKYTTMAEWITRHRCVTFARYQDRWLIMHQQHMLRKAITDIHAINNSEDTLQDEPIPMEITIPNQTEESSPTETVLHENKQDDTDTHTTDPLLPFNI